MGITAKIEELIELWIGDNCTDWTSMLSGLYEEDDIPETVDPPYAEWSWVTENDISPSTGGRLEYSTFQIVFYGNDRKELNIIKDLAQCSLNTTTKKSVDIGFGILVFLDFGIRAMKNRADKKDRFGKFMAVSQFWLRAQHEIT